MTQVNEQTNGTTDTPADNEPKCFLHGKGCKNHGTPPLVYVTINGEKSPIHGVPREKGLKSCVQVLEEMILAKDEKGLPKYFRDAEGNPLYTLGHGGNVRFEDSDELKEIHRKSREKAKKKELKREDEELRAGVLALLKPRGPEGPTAMGAAMQAAGVKGSEAPKEEQPTKKKGLFG